jgi:membrane-associated protein
VDLLTSLADICLHIDKYLGTVVATHGPLTYALLFTIVFLETGLVVTPFLPGDSLLFAAGSFAATGVLDLVVLFVTLSTAAIVGDTVNYLLGATLGPRVFRFKRSRWFNPAHLQRTGSFFERHGPKTIVLARFVPIVRTFAPFVAGVGAMRYATFLLYNVAGAVLWVGSCLLAGYFFGNLRVVRDNFGLVVLAIILTSVLPAGLEILKHRRDRRTTRSAEVLP